MSPKAIARISKSAAAYFRSRCSFPSLLGYRCQIAGRGQPSATRPTIRLAQMGSTYGTRSTWQLRACPALPVWTKDGLDMASRRLWLHGSGRARFASLWPTTTTGNARSRVKEHCLPWTQLTSVRMATVATIHPGMDCCCAKTFTAYLTRGTSPLRQRLDLKSAARSKKSLKMEGTTTPFTDAQSLRRERPTRVLIRACLLGTMSTFIAGKALLYYA